MAFDYKENAENQQINLLQSSRFGEICGLTWDNSHWRGLRSFYYTVLCNYANFRTSYLRIDGIGYTVYPGEWIYTVKELSTWSRTRFQCQAVSILDELQKRHLISYLFLDRGKVVKYKVRDWKKHNTVLDYNCPCQKDTGFFFMPIVVATELVSAGRCSEMDILLDLWMSAVYNDSQVQGSEIGPVVYFRNGTGSPLAAYSEMAVRWGISKATTGRVLKKLADMDYISLMSFPGRKGSVIYLHSYLSTMFQISDVLVDKEEVAIILKINITMPDETVYPLSDACREKYISQIQKDAVRRLLKLLDTSIDLLRTRHKNGENYY